MGQRLFAKNVFLGLHCRSADRRVPVIRRGDHDGVERFLLLEQLAVIGVRLDAPCLGLVAVLGVSDLVGVDIAERRNMVPELQRVPDVALDLAAHADEGDVEPVVRPEHGAREDDRRGRDSGEKSAAFHDV